MIPKERRAESLELGGLDRVGFVVDLAGVIRPFDRIECEEPLALDEKNSSEAPEPPP